MVFFAALSILRPSRGDSLWTYVPASLERRPLETFAIAETPTEKVVTVVGADRPAPHPHSEPLRVFSVDIPVPSPGRDDQPPPPGAAAAAFPEGAHWPDATGRIVAAPPAPTASKGAVLRNPWEVRIHSGPAGVDTLFVCGGIVAGGEGGSVAILNGHVVRRGDTLGRFGVARIAAVGVVLERDGSYFVIPLGRRTTITFSGG
jgi:hypothetical protein